MSNICEFLGLIVSIYVIIRLVVKLVNNLGTFWFNLGQVDDFKSFGRWALVTGGSDGIGRAYAHELASRGLNIVIISNQPDENENTAQYIRNKFNVLVKFINADFRGIKVVLFDLK